MTSAWKDAPVVMLTGPRERGTTALVRNFDRGIIATPPILDAAAWDGHSWSLQPTDVMPNVDGVPRDFWVHKQSLTLF